MNKTFDVLWFDDESDKLESIVEKALEYGINLEGVKNSEEGLLKLQSQSRRFDAVLLDGKFHENAIDQKNGVISDNAFGKVAIHLKSESDSGNYIPWFILSGQTNFAKEEHSLVKLLGQSSYGDGKVFDKNLDEEDTLFSLMIQSIADSETFKIRNKYSIILELINNKYLGQSEEERLMTIVKNLESSNNDYSTNELFTPIRKVLEKMMDKLRDLGVIDSEVKGLNASSLFIAGKNSSYIYKSKILSPTVDYLFKTVLDIVNDATHNKEDLKLNIEEHLQTNKYSYLYQATAYQFFEILIWFKSFVDANQNIEINQARWEKSIENNESVKGKLQQDSNGNYQIGKYLFPYNNVNEVFEIGQMIEITKFDQNTNSRTNDMYPYFVLSFKKIES